MDLFTDILVSSRFMMAIMKASNLWDDDYLEAFQQGLKGFQSVMVSKSLLNSVAHWMYLSAYKKPVSELAANLEVLKQCCQKMQTSHQRIAEARDVLCSDNGSVKFPEVKELADALQEGLQTLSFGYGCQLDHITPNFAKVFPSSFRLLLAKAQALCDLGEVASGELVACLTKVVAESPLALSP